MNIGTPYMPQMPMSVQALTPNDMPDDTTLSEAIQRHLGTQSTRGLMSNDALLSSLSREFPINQSNLAQYSKKVGELRTGANSQVPAFDMITGKFGGEPL